MVEVYYVLESIVNPGYYLIDDQIMLTENIKAADKYDLKLAKRLAKKDKDFRVKKVTVEYKVEGID